MKIHEKLQWLRRNMKWSQEELADRLQVSRQAVAKWESGQSWPDVENLLGISEVFGVSLDSLLKKDECGAVLTQRATGVVTKLKAFVRRAKQATYAGKGPECECSRPQSHDLRYEEAELLYIDTYLGGECFAGEEAIWEHGQPIWAMNYCGRVLESGFSGEFLKEALSAVPEESPYRGPRQYQRDAFSYHCIIDGSFEWFSGYEEIFQRGIVVYDCRFHGGMIR